MQAYSTNAIGQRPLARPAMLLIKGVTIMLQRNRIDWFADWIGTEHCRTRNSMQQKGKGEEGNRGRGRVHAMPTCDPPRLPRGRLTEWSSSRYWLRVSFIHNCVSHSLAWSWHWHDNAPTSLRSPHHPALPIFLLDLVVSLILRTYVSFLCDLT